MDSDLRQLCLELLKKALMDILQSGREHLLPVRQMEGATWKLRALQRLDGFLRTRKFLVAHSVRINTEERLQGKGVWPMHAHRPW
jgi:hypothetical protein